MDEHRFSVIIACEHSPESLNHTLTALLALQPMRASEVITVDDESYPGREEVAREAIGKGLPVRFIDSAGIGRAAAWNLAVHEATGDILAFLDDDCIPPPGWLDAFSVSFENEAAGVVGGPDTVPSGAPIFERCMEYVLTSFIGTLGMRSGGSSVSSYYPRPWNMAARRDLVLETAGFDESTPEAPEIRLIKQLEQMGFRAFFQPKAVVRHHRETDVQGFISRDFRLAVERGMGWGQPKVDRVYGSAVLFLLLMALLSRGTAVSRIPSGFASFYMGALAFSGAHAVVKTKSPLLGLLVPPLLLAHHAAHLGGYILGRIARSLRGKR